MTYKIESGVSRLVEGLYQLTEFIGHPDNGEKGTNGGIYGGIGSIVRACGFVRVWQGSGMETAPVYMFGTESESWAEMAVRNYPREFYMIREPMDAYTRFLYKRLPPCDNQDCPVGCPDSHEYLSLDDYRADKLRKINSEYLHL